MWNRKRYFNIGTGYSRPIWQTCRRSCLSRRTPTLASSCPAAPSTSTAATSLHPPRGCLSSRQTSINVIKLSFLLSLTVEQNTLEFIRGFIIIFFRSALLTIIRLTGKKNFGQTLSLIVTHCHWEKKVFLALTPSQLGQPSRAWTRRRRFRGWETFPRSGILVGHRQDQKFGELCRRLLK